jgi:hypothetical protein
MSSEHESIKIVIYKHPIIDIKKSFICRIIEKSKMHGFVIVFNGL